MYGSILVKNIVFVLLVRVRQYPNRSEITAERRIEKSTNDHVMEDKVLFMALSPARQPKPSRHAPPRSNETQMTGTGARRAIASPSNIHPILDNIDAHRIANTPARNLSCFMPTELHPCPSFSTRRVTCYANTKR
jgi:hypothetical protein